MSLSGRFGPIIFHMVIDMDETRLQTIAQLSAFLNGTLEVRFSVPASDDERYAHIAGVATLAIRGSNVRIREWCCATCSAPVAIPVPSSPAY